ncbi:protein RRP5 homolog isoform X1 [Stegodyphus dumicola]|uniref:protein RRP5 homolog isoform X1 n=1 Tax=Stegodyphus dumicola TaxID=202533 RepID=UPI0015ACB097|nr:protein RRP5 homolog isoform X1 [Stegodyphus dumicola]
MDENAGELLNNQTVMTEMLLLGCVIETRTDCFLMSLPGCLVGFVPITNISTKFSERITKYASGEGLEELSLDSVIKLGMCMPCKVLEIIQRNSGRKPKITLSIKPEDIHSHLKLQSLYLKMVLHVSIHSMEDHGYTVDVGIKGVRGFLPFTSEDDQSKLQPGEIIPTYITKISGNSVVLGKLNFNETFPEVTNENIRLDSILPGANVSGYVTEIKKPFAYLNCLNFEGCANVLSLGCSSKKVHLGKVSGTVLYIQPVSNIIYLLLSSKPTPNSFSTFFHIKKFDLIQNSKFEFWYRNHGYCKIQRNIFGFFNKEDNANDKSNLMNHLSKDCVIPRARAVFLHYIDNLVQLSLKPYITDIDIKRIEEIKIGDVFEATVKRHLEGGMIAFVSPGLNGYIRYVHMSDVYVTKPEKLFPVGSKLICRVVYTDNTSVLYLTCKSSLVNLPKDEILQSYEDAHEGKHYKGVIVQITDKYIIVLFFNNVKGMVSSHLIPKSSVFFEGQTVTCEVVHCNPLKKRLKLCLKDIGLHSKEEERHLGGKKCKIYFGTALEKSSNSVKELPAEKSTLSQIYINKEGCDTHYDTIRESSKPYKAVIKKKSQDQLNIFVNGIARGRVHITEVGCSEEGINPLQCFHVGQKLKVYVIGKSERECGNFLLITHRKMIKFLECAVHYPPPVLLPANFHVGQSLMGFIKEVHDVCAVLWLSPNQSGTLEYLHFSEKPKVLRKLKKKLRAGFSLKVIISESEKLVNKEEKFILLRPGISIPDTSKNVVGLVQIACADRGLILKLPHGYHGVVELKELQDSDAPIEPLLTKYQKLRFILCHVLEVNHDTKYCILSLRRSRLYKSKAEPKMMTGNTKQEKETMLSQRLHVNEDISWDELE